MSVIPAFSASFVGLGLVGLFLWKVSFVFIVLVCVVLLIVIFLYDSLSCVVHHYESAFWLFVLSECSVFGSFLICCLFFDCWSYVSLSSSLEIPFVGCFVLLGSSITVTGFHHLLGWRCCDLLLFMTIVLGLSFVVLQILEMEEVSCNIVDGSFYSSSFCTVGLHFSHVVLGVIGLVTLFLVGSDNFGVYRCTVLAWYWHFVDYIWLLVYTVVYVC
uniref:Cytochrome c oxidase subunit 3 n=1 Tax=Echinococcus granulosus TaxID=6210 RepID=U6FRG2_ECHGR|nr:Cytochrome c oxidase subunit III [Echinococcus granulosus]